MCCLVWSHLTLTSIINIKYSYDVSDWPAPLIFFFFNFWILTQHEQVVMIAQSLWLFIIALQANIYVMKSLPQISLVMASWLLKAIPPSFSHSFSLPCSLTLPFCHVCRESYRVAVGFLFSGNALDERKATWSDLRGTTCRRLIFSFPSFHFRQVLFLLIWSSSRGAWWERGFGLTAMGLSPGFLLARLPTPSCVFCMSLFCEAEECWARVTPRSGVTASESVRGLKQYGRSRGGGGK